MTTTATTADTPLSDYFVQDSPLGLSDPFAAWDADLHPEEYGDQSGFTATWEDDHASFSDGDEDAHSISTHGDDDDEELPGARGRELRERDVPVRLPGQHLAGGHGGGGVRRILP